MGADQPRPGVPEHEYLRAGLPRPGDVCVLPEVGDGVDDNVRVGREEHAVDEDAAVDCRGHRLRQVREGGRGDDDERLVGRVGEIAVRAALDGPTRPHYLEPYVGRVRFGARVLDGRLQVRESRRQLRDGLARRSRPQDRRTRALVDGHEPAVDQRLGHLVDVPLRHVRCVGHLPVVESPNAHRRSLIRDSLTAESSLNVLKSVFRQGTVRSGVQPTSDRHGHRQRADASGLRSRRRRRATGQGGRR